MAFRPCVLSPSVIWLYCRENFYLHSGWLLLYLKSRKAYCSHGFRECWGLLQMSAPLWVKKRRENAAEERWRDIFKPLGENVIYLHLINGKKLRFFFGILVQSLVCQFGCCWLCECVCASSWTLEAWGWLGFTQTGVRAIRAGHTKSTRLCNRLWHQPASMNVRARQQS